MSNTLVSQKTHNGQFPPKMFEENTLDLIKKSGSFGLNEESLHRVNEKRYMRNLDILSKDGNKLAIMPEQTNEMVLTALYQNIGAFKYVAEQNEEVCEFALSINPEIIHYFHVQTDEQIMYAIGSNVENIKFIREPKIEHIKFALSIDWYRTLENLKKAFITDEVIKLAIEEHADNFHRDTTPLKFLCNQELVDYAIAKDIRFVRGVEGKYLTNEIIWKFLTDDKTNHMSNKLAELSWSATALLTYKQVSKIMDDYWCAHLFNRINQDYITADLLKKYVNKYGVSLDDMRREMNSETINRLTDEELILIWPNGIRLKSIHRRDSELLVKHALKYAIKNKSLREDVGDITYYCGKDFKYIRYWWAILAKLRLL